ncbi:MAG: homoserine kinase, partial [Pseudomonadota bacterium]|nr:homoserine kinase [Pseudomonadota bacterium]
MSVYTELSFAQIQAFAGQYQRRVIQIQPIQNGIENSNWFVDFADGDHAVLTLFEALNFDQANNLAGLLDGIALRDLPVATPYVNSVGQRLGWLADKPAQFAPRLNGKHPILPSHLQCQAMGQGLAQLHLAMQSVDFEQTNAHGQGWWQQAAAELRPAMNTDEQRLLDQLFMRFASVQSEVGDVPRGLIHGDLFRDNTLFCGDQLSGVLDFSECCVDEYLLDIAITLNDFCSDWPSVTLDQDKYAEFLQGYQDIRPLTHQEQIALPVYLAMAAGRFWLSRLQVAQRNQVERRVGAHVLQKDPNEMREMVLDR